MKIYKWRVREFDGVSIGYTSSLVEAKRQTSAMMKIARERAKELKEDHYDDVNPPELDDIQCFDVPISKAGFLAFLNNHTPSTDNG